MGLFPTPLTMEPGRKGSGNMAHVLKHPPQRRRKHRLRDERAALCEHAARAFESVQCHGFAQVVREMLGR